MKKIERVYREILFQALEEGKRELTQQFLEERCETSIGNVNYALKPLEGMNAVEKKLRSFLVLSPKKILLYWASHRNLGRDIIFGTHSDMDVRKIEKSMPPCIFTAYSGYKYRFGEPPAGYSEVYLYATKDRIEERFPPEEGKENIFVLKPDEHLEKFEEIPIAQLYVDLWNLNTWYAQEFIDKLEEELNGILE